MIPTCQAGVSPRTTSPHTEQETLREYGGKYVASHFKHVEFDAPSGRTKHLTVLQIGDIRCTFFFHREGNCSTQTLNNLPKVRASSK